MLKRTHWRNPVLLKLFGADYEERCGDLDEFYQDLRESHSALYAATWRSLQILRIISKSAISQTLWSIEMLFSYLKTSLRNIKRHRSYSLINILGLSLGIAASLLAMLWIQDEKGYDRFHTHYQQIHKVYNTIDYENVQQLNYTASYYPLAALLTDDIPEVENTVRLMIYPNIQLRAQDLVMSDNRVCFADPSIFSIFSFPLIEGDPATAFNNRHSIVITRSAARRYFGDADPMGRTINLLNRRDLIVTGIINDVPRQSSLQFDAIAPFALILPSEELQAEWGGNPFHTFALLRPGADIVEVEQKINGAVKIRRNLQDDRFSYPLHPFTKYHLYMPDGGGLHKTLLILSLTAAFILLIACINFVNLGTARASTRSMEVGLRKTLGADRRDLIRQFMGESLLLVLSAAGLALLFTVMALPYYCQIIQKTLPLGNLLRGEMLLGLLAILGLSILMTGAYPSWIMTRFQPVNAVKRGTPARGSQAILRRVLVIFQFSLSILLIIAMLTLGRQMHYIQNKDLGFDTENLIELFLPHNLKPQYDTIKNELLKLPGIESVTMALQNPNRMGSNTSAIEWTGKNPETQYTFNFEVVGFDYGKTMKLQIVDGRLFSKAHATDDGKTAIVNETAARLMGFEKAVGQSIRIWDNPSTIVGVVKDFHCRSLHHPIEPLIYWIDTEWPSNMYIRIGSERKSETLAAVKRFLTGMNPDTPINIRFVEDLRMERNYQAEQRMGTITRLLTALALIISAMGLLGLATFMVERKVNEIGIRKVMGASSVGIVIGLIQDFSRWVVVAMVLATPAGIWVVKRILSSYAYRTPVSPVLFLLAGGSALLVSWLAVSIQSFKAAMANPVHSLRAE